MYYQYTHATEWPGGGANTKFNRKLLIFASYLCCSNTEKLLSKHPNKVNCDINIELKPRKKTGCSKSVCTMHLLKTRYQFKKQSYF